MSSKMYIAISLIVIASAAWALLPANASLVPLTNAPLLSSMNLGNAPSNITAMPTPAAMPSPAPTVDPSTYQPETYSIPFELDSLTDFPTNTPAFQQFNQLNSGIYDDYIPGGISSGISPVNLGSYEILPFDDSAYSDVPATFDASAFEDMISQMMSGI